MDYPEALGYLNSFIDYERQDSYDYNRSFKIDRMRKMASRLGDPQSGIKSIHVAGTKGKGSTCAFVHSILKSAGFRAGLYTSPHLVSFRERIRINDSLISEEDIGKLTGKVKSIVDEMGGEGTSFFEVYTALAYLYFKEKRVDFAVYETGLGGRLDATNIIQPLAAAITPISYDHMDKLGRTLKEIAMEKAGIIKDKSICVMAPQDREAREVIEGVCAGRKTRIISVGKDVKFKEISASDKSEVFAVSGMFNDYPALETALLGQHQVVNAATAIGIIEALRYRDIVISPAAVMEGIKSARWEGRLEAAGARPLIVLDGAQNKASAGALAKAVKRSFKYNRLILVLGISKDKDIKGVLEELLPISDSVVLTKSKLAGRACEPSRIKDLMGPGKEAVLTSSVSEALDKAALLALPDDLILVTGSLFVVGEAKERKALACGTA